MSGSVIQEWVSELPFKMQTVLLTAVRVHDGVSKYDKSKNITKAIRSCILKNADIRTEFMPDTTLIKPVTAFCLDLIKDCDYYSVHWLCHSMHAIEIIGYKHPDEKTREDFCCAYRILVSALHLNIETERELSSRLKSEDQITD